VPSTLFLEAQIPVTDYSELLQSPCYLWAFLNMVLNVPDRSLVKNILLAFSCLCYLPSGVISSKFFLWKVFLRTTAWF